ncbi:hypothetical protein Tco_1320898 [Tanacetum coccineum]
MCSLLLIKNLNFSSHRLGLLVLVFHKGDDPLMPSITYVLLDFWRRNKTSLAADGTEIHMLAERKYPLIKETLERMLSLRLVAGTASEDAYTLLRFIQKQIDEYGSHDGDIKNWLVQSKRLLLASPKQTALGKDISNPLIVDSLLKTIWLSMHHVIAMKHWLFQSKRLLGRIVGFQKFLQLSAATYTSYYCQFYLVLLMKNAIDSRK